MPDTTRQQRPPSRTQRTFRLLEPVTRRRAGRVRISEVKGRKTVHTDYIVTCLDAYDGEALALEWANTRNGGVYHCLLAHRDAGCDCMGHLARGRCRHYDCSLLLFSRGQLPQGGAA